MGMGRTTWKQLVLAACRSVSLLHPPSSRAIIKQENSTLPHHHDKSDSTTLCAICLEPLSHCDEAMFTGQCSHSFHFSCIASNVRHGSVTCPVCRAHWSYLPCSRRQLDDPVFHDDPINPLHSTTYPRLHFSLIPLTVSANLLSYPQSLHLHQSAYSLLQMPQDCHCLCKRNAYLSVKLTNLQPIDLVLVVNPSEPHLRLLKQAMILVTFSLRPVDRLAIVTYSARVFPLIRMTSYGKRTALSVIDRLFYRGQTDPSQGVLKGIKVVRDRAYKNPRCSILHISTSPIRHYPMGVMVHRFHLGFGIHKLEEVLEKKVLGGGVAVRDIQLRIRMGMEEKIVNIADLRGGEERQVLLHLALHLNLRLCYSYVEGDTSIRRRGETSLRFVIKNS